MCNNRL